MQLSQWLKSWRTAGGNLFAEVYGGIITNAAGRSPIVSPTWGASVAIDASAGNFFNIVATNNVAYTIANPTNASAGHNQWLLLRIKNTSGGALGAATFDTLYKLGAAWTNPANGFSRSILFTWDLTNWVEAFRSAADVAN
jgi:hypothetical protein